MNQPTNPPTLTADEIARLRDLLARATPGPWTLNAVRFDDGIIRGDPTWCGVNCMGPIVVIRPNAAQHTDCDHDPLDLPVIVELRNRADALLAMADEALRLRAQPRPTVRHFVASDGADWYPWCDAGVCFRRAMDEDGVGGFDPVEADGIDHRATDDPNEATCAACLSRYDADVLAAELADEETLRAGLERQRLREKLDQTERLLAAAAHDGDCAKARAELQHENVRLRATLDDEIETARAVMAERNNLRAENERLQKDLNARIGAGEELRRQFNEAGFNDFQHCIGVARAVMAERDHLRTENERLRRLTTEALARRRKVIQLATLPSGDSDTADGVVVLCDDGSMWRCYFYGGKDEWQRFGQDLETMP